MVPLKSVGTGWTMALKSSTATTRRNAIAIPATIAPRARKTAAIIHPLPGGIVQRANRSTRVRLHLWRRPPARRRDTSVLTAAPDHPSAWETDGRSRAPAGPIAAAVQDSPRHRLSPP